MRKSSHTTYGNQLMGPTKPIYDQSTPTFKTPTPKKVLAAIWHSSHCNSPLDYNAHFFSPPIFGASKFMSLFIWLCLFLWALIHAYNFQSSYPPWLACEVFSYNNMITSFPLNKTFTKHAVSKILNYGQFISKFMKLFLNFKTNANQPTVQITATQTVNQGG